MEKHKVKFSVSKKGFFYAQLKERLNIYFSLHQNNDKATAGLILKLTKTVSLTVAEFNITIRENSLLNAIASHLRLLKHMG